MFEMELTEEQRQRIAENKARALEIRKRKESERASQQSTTTSPAAASHPFDGIYGSSGKQSRSAEDSNTVEKVEEREGGRAGTEQEGGDERDEDKACCELCGTQEIVQNYWTIWEVAICRKCGRTSNDYELLNKTDASKEYLIPDDTLKFIPYMEKENPRHAEWAPMKMYMRRMVKAASMERWGSEEGLADEKLSRETSKMQRDLVKMKDGIARDKRSTYNEEKVEETEFHNDAKMENEVFEKMFGDMDSSSLYTGPIVAEQEQREKRKEVDGDGKQNEEGDVEVKIKQEPPKKKAKKNKLAGMVYQKPNKGDFKGSPVAALKKKKKNPLSGMIGAIRGKK